MKHILLYLILPLLLLTSCSRGNEEARTIEDFNFDWSFTLGDKKAYSAPDYNDTDWRQLHLPHDWSIEGEFSRKHRTTTAGGALPAGVGWYRKSFVTPNLNGKLMFVEFDGIFQNSTIYVNGVEVGGRPYGYASASYNITEYLKPTGEQNVIAVRVDNSAQPASRWYTGSGIYRNVRLVTCSELHIGYMGTHITTPEIRENEAKIRAVVTLNNLSDEAKTITLENIILNARSKEVQRSTVSRTIEAGQSANVEMYITIEAPRLWNIGKGYLYTMRSVVMEGEKSIDVYDTKFGIRDFEFKADTGFWLNGENIKLKGACLYHDLGALGSAVHRRALERQLDIMQSAGVNAILTAHNPPSPQLLELCDERGIVVVVEAFDTWQHAKTHFDYSRYFAKWWERDITDMVKRDRNHPSIIVWSVGNEVQEQWDISTSNPDRNRSIQLTRNIVEAVKRQDNTRPVTATCNHIRKNNNLLRSEVLDIIGINYNHEEYDTLHSWYSELPMLATKNINDANSISHEASWLAVRDREYIAGSFITSAFDYLGEPTPHSWPSRSSRYGIVDLAGFEKDIYYFYRSEWTDNTTLHLFPHWTWNEGDKVDLYAYYNNADEVELFVNNNSMGKSSKTENQLHAEWKGIEFEAGEITAVSYKDGKEVARHTHKTALEPAKLKLSVDKSMLKADGYDLAYITVECYDQYDSFVPTATNQLYIDIEGAGELMGVDNGNPAGTESLKGSKIKLHNGKALIIVRTLKDIPGSISVDVRCDGVDDTEIILTSK